MDLQVTEYKRCNILKATGRIDSASAMDVETALMELVAKDKAIIFDMSGVDFVSSAGWWSVIRAQKELKKGNKGEMVLVGLNDNIRDSMDLIGILPYFTIYEQLIDAIGNV